MVSAERDPGHFAYEEVEPLIAALDDPEEAVRVAVLRALLRLGGYLDRRTIERVWSLAPYELQRVELEFITYLPSDEVVTRLLRDLERLRLVVDGYPAPQDYDPESFQQLSSEAAARYVTESFAALVCEKFPYAHWSDIREGAGDVIAEWVSVLDGKFKPGIEALFYVYAALQERVSSEKRRFLAQMRDQEYLDINRDWPSFWPWGPVTVSWQIAWAASRAGVRAVLRAIGPEVRDGASGVRWAAAQFIEESVRWTLRFETLRFGGGAGPEDIDLSMWRTDRLEAPESLPDPSLPPTEAWRDEVPKAPLPAPQADAWSAEPSPRYADFTFYKEDGSGNRTGTLTEEMPLKMGIRYQLEVAVRLQATGIKPENERQPIREPRQKGPVEIIVTAASEHFVIPQPVQKLILPPTGASVENACFKGVGPRYATVSGFRFPLQIRLYYKCNLLEVATIEAEVVDRFDPETLSRFGLIPPIKLTQERLEQEYHNFELVQPREMHIDVTRGPAGIRFTFILDRGKKDEIAFSGRSQIGEQDVENTLLGIRKTLLGITLWNEFLSSVDCEDETRFNTAMNKLAQLGSKLWNDIFCYDTNSSLYLIGEWLRSNPLPLRSTIQVSVEANASTFILPWNILYDKDVPHDESERPDIQGFWGLRYAIEQRVPGAQNKPDDPIFVEGKVEVGYLLSRFNEAVDQERCLNEFVRRSGGRMRVLPPIDTREPAYQYLQDCSSDIVYFFAHGHTQFPNANRYGFSTDDFIKLYDNLPTDSLLRTNWEEIYRDIKRDLYDSDTSWIKLEHGKLLLNNLYGPGKLKLHKHPLVFLNMCESAQVTPTAGQSFIHVFMNRGARGVLGTECMMRPFIAHQFAAKFFEGLLSGNPVGEVLLDLRQEFIERNYSALLTPQLCINSSGSPGRM